MLVTGWDQSRSPSLSQGRKRLCKASPQRRARKTGKSLICTMTSRHDLVFLLDTIFKNSSKTVSSPNDVLLCRLSVPEKEDVECWPGEAPTSSLSAGARLSPDSGDQHRRFGSGFLSLGRTGR